MNIQSSPQINDIRSRMLNIIIIHSICITFFLFLSRDPANAGINTLLSNGTPVVYEHDLSFFSHLMPVNEPTHVIIVEKKHQRVSVLEIAEETRLISRYACATGEKRGKKEKSGDARTPEGVYFITKYFIDNKITIFGNQAYHLDFPNSSDRAAGRNGSGIYIHGTNKKLTPYSTNGCITLSNHDLEELSLYLKIGRTPVLIVPSISDMEQRHAQRTADLQIETVKTMLLPADISSGSVNYDNLYVIDDGHQMVAAGEFKITGSHTASDNYGYSRIYLDSTLGKGWTLLARNWQTTTAEAEVARRSPVLISQRKSYPRDKREILEFLDKWQTAWESKEIDTYMSFYDKTFRHRNMNRASWRKYKKRLYGKYKSIDVDVYAPNVNWSDNGAIVTFDQVYRSDQYYEEGKKTLQLVHNGRTWHIKRETSFPVKGGQDGGYSTKNSFADRSLDIDPYQYQR